jgi:ABC-type glycerol-3-phosphate transport system substrate-binding protein
VQFIIALIARLVGAAFCCGGFRFFLLLLPIWGFVVGFNVGTDAVTSLFSDGTFATALSWVVGLVLALLFAVFSYLWYWLAIALLGGSVGYIIGTSAWGLIGNEQGLVAFGIGLVCAVALAIAVLALNVPKLLVIVLTGLGGAATIVTGWFVLTGAIPTDNIHWTTVGHQITQSWFWLIVWGVLAAAGILAQLRSTTVGPDTYELDRTSYRYA